MKPVKIKAQTTVHEQRDDARKTNKALRMTIKSAQQERDEAWMFYPFPVLMNYSADDVRGNVTINPGDAERLARGELVLGAAYQIKDGGYRLVGFGLVAAAGAGQVLTPNPGPRLVE